MVYQLLHFSDLHLDASFAADGVSPAVGAWRRDDLRATLGRILALARERKVDAVTIGGDLYDHDYAVPDTGGFLSQQFARLAPMQVFIAPGEHDPYTTRSLYALTQWSSNVHIFRRGELTSIQLAPHVRLWGAAHPAAQDNRVLERTHADRSGNNVLLLHATEKSATKSGSETHFVVDEGALRKAGFDFALLGHQHTTRTWPDGAPCCAYPGSPEPLCWEDAVGGHGVGLVTIDEGQIRYEPISISQWRYWGTEVELSGCPSLETALKRLHRSLATAPGGSDERLFCRITLTGSPDFDLDCTALESALETKAHVDVETRLALGRNLEQLAAEQTVRGLLVRRFQARLAEPKDPEKRQATLKALALALDALDGRQVRPHEVA